MTKEEIDKLKESLDEAIGNMTSRTWRLQDALDNFRERLEEARAAFGKLQAEDLNALIVAGFIPGAKVKYKDAEYQFIGYTEAGRMEFRDAIGNSKFADISVCRKMSENFIVLNGDEQKGTDK